MKFAQICSVFAVALALLAAGASSVNALDVALSTGSCRYVATSTTASTVTCALPRTTVQTTIQKLTLYFLPSTSGNMTCAPSVTSTTGAVTSSKAGVLLTASARSVSFDSLGGSSAGKFFQITCTGVLNTWKLIGITYTE